ncbi:MAG: hypothetical protein WC768_00160 [Patescibacteria group bacterium]|jgi:hypothetical protein
MKVIYPGYDVVSLFSSSSQTQALTRKQTNYELVINLLGVFLVVLALVITLRSLQYFLNVGARPIATETIETNQVVPVVIYPSQAISAYIDTGSGYLGR